LFRFTRRTLPLPENPGQGLVEYALILSLVAIVILIAMSVMGSALKMAYCQVISQFPGAAGFCVVDEVVIIKAQYDPDIISGIGPLHLDATSNGDYDPATTLTASPGGVMEAKNHHYHLGLSSLTCPCEVTITSSAGGVAVWKHPPEP